MPDSDPSVGLQEFGGVCGQYGQSCSYYVMLLLEKKRVNGSGKGMLELQGGRCEDSAVQRGPAPKGSPESGKQTCNAAPG